MLMLAPTLNDYLPAAVRKGSRVSRQTVDLNGHDGWTIRFDTNTGVPATVTVTLDPEKGYAVASTEVRTKTSTPADGRMQVLEYREVEPGLFIPVRIRGTGFSQPKGLIEQRVTRLQVNQPVRADSLVVNFPEGMKVQDTRNGSMELDHIWGKDKPRLTLDSREKLAAYERTFYQRNPGMGGFLWVAAGLIVSAIALLNLRKRLIAEDGRN